MTQLPIDGMPLPERATDPDEQTAWWNTAYAAVVERAQRGGTFTIYDVAHDAHVGEPHHPNMWGVLAGALRRDGIILEAGAVAGRRPSVAKSLVHLWTGTGRAAA
ncbi:hypothetical protein B4N89_27335 [Embleya scabrispora]|uniref:Uncharacterized protein n=1 Tax=Embleya scabrispora TaxID=159449 RepID=A0A1T3P5C8_9ACTN|nr:hypothetical protein [Embleya scabrispora]OPC84145.1 hypothetical protein B4N89_27335 [Embleya scabrispora]